MGVCGRCVVVFVREVDVHQFLLEGSCMFLSRMSRYISVLNGWKDRRRQKEGPIT